MSDQTFLLLMYFETYAKNPCFLPSFLSADGATVGKIQ